MKYKIDGATQYGYVAFIGETGYVVASALGTYIQVAVGYFPKGVRNLFNIDNVLFQPVHCLSNGNAQLANLGNIRESANQVSTGADDLANAAQGLAEGATTQAAAVEELTATSATVADPQFPLWSG